MSDVSGMFKNVNWDDIESQDDYESEIPALRGDYKGEVKDFRFIDTDTGGFFSLNVQITETVKGTKGDNRYVSRTFNLGETEYATEEENKERLLKALKTMGATTPEGAIGKTICMKIRPNTYRDGDKKGEVKVDTKGWPKHIVTIVSGFKGATDSANVTDAGSSRLPF